MPQPGWKQVAALITSSLLLLAGAVPLSAQIPARDMPAAVPSKSATTEPPPSTIPSPSPAPLSPPAASPAIPPAIPPGIPAAGAGLSASSAGVEEVKPEVFYLQDKDGNLLPVPDLRLEEYQRLYNQHRGLVAPDPPRFVLQACTASGQVEGDHAVFQVEFQIQTTDQAKSDAWMRVPLRLNQLVLRGPAKYVGSGRQFLEFQALGDGYVCWLQADKNTDHRLTLTLAAPLAVEGGTTRLELETPQVPSHIELQVPQPGVEASVSRQNANILRPPKPAGTGTQLVLDGLGGEVQLSWRAAPDKLTASEPRLDATGSIRVTVEGLGQISYEALLRVRSFGGSVDAFRVRLPPRMHLVPLDQPGYRVIELAESDEDAADRGQLVEIRLSSATSNDVSVRLLLERIPEERAGGSNPSDGPEGPGGPTKATGAPGPVPGAPAEPPTWLEVGSLDVQGAVRQRGYIDFAVEGEFSLDWQASDGIIRRDDIPEATRQQQVVARFEYFRQPSSLKVQLRRKEKRVRVEPTYELQVGGGQVQLKAVLKCRVTGETAFRLKADFSQWIVDSVDRGEWETPDRVSLDQVAPLEVPVVANGTSLAEGFTITVFAHRDFMTQAETLTVPLPQPLQTTRARASITVSALDNVDLTIGSLEQQGLLLDPLPAGSARLHRFREQSPGSAQSLVFDLRVQPRLVVLSAETGVSVSAERIEVSGRLNYEILYEPLRELQLQIPRSVLQANSVAEGSKLMLSWDDQSLPLEGSWNPKENSEFVTVTVVLPEPAVGSHLLTVSYSLPGLKLQRDREAEVLVPLVVPAAGMITRLERNELRLELAENLEVELTERSWRVADGLGAPSESAGRLDLVSDGLATAVAFRARGMKRPLSQVARVPLAWLQTLMTRTDRLDRFSFRIAQAGEAVRIQLPAGARGDGLRVAVDRQPASEVLIDDFGQVTVPMAGVAEPDTGQADTGQADTGQADTGQADTVTGDEHVVELWYWFEGREAANREMRLDPPVIIGAEPAERTYWQVVVPGDEHLVGMPDNVTPELSWAWNGFYWGRQANLTQRDLESLVGGLRQNELPGGMNKYLFMSFGPLEPLQLVVASRHLLLLLASGIVLVGGLLILYQPSLRHPALLLLVAVVLVAVGLWAPELTLLLGQAAGLGLLLFLLARLLDGALGGRRRRALGMRGLAGPDSRTLDMPVVKPESAATTATARMAVQLSETDPR